MASKPDSAAFGTRKLYAIAAQRFPRAIENTTIYDLQQSAYRQIVGGMKRASIWARQNGVTADFAYALIVAHLREQLAAEADARERTARATERLSRLVRMATAC